MSINEQYDLAARYIQDASEEVLKVINVIYNHFVELSHLANHQLMAFETIPRGLDRPEDSLYSDIYNWIHDLFQKMDIYRIQLQAYNNEYMKALNEIKQK